MSSERIWIDQEEDRRRRINRRLLILVLICSFIMLSAGEGMGLSERLSSLRAARRMSLFLGELKLKSMRTQRPISVRFTEIGQLDVREVEDCPAVPNSNEVMRAGISGSHDLHMPESILGKDMHILSSSQARNYLMEGEVLAQNICFHPRKPFTGELVIILAYGNNFTGHRGILPMARVSVSGNNADINID